MPFLIPSRDPDPLTGIDHLLGLGKSVQSPEHIWFSKAILDYNVGGFVSESIYMEYK